MASSGLIERRRLLSVFGLAVLLTTGAEFFYLVVWGMMLFPEGSLAGKAIWTATCGVAMGAVIGLGTLFFAVPRHGTSLSIWIATAMVLGVGSYCAWLCSAIEARFSYFGGPENTELFIVAGVGPAAIGGVLYGWVLYGRRPFNTKEEEYSK